MQLQISYNHRAELYMLKKENEMKKKTKRKFAVMKVIMNVQFLHYLLTTSSTKIYKNS